MSSILNLSGLNYGSTNPLRNELTNIREYIARVEKSMKELAAGGAGGGALTGAKGITAGLKEVALQIVNMRSEIESLKSTVTRIELSADSHQKRVDKAIADLTSRMTLAETAVASTSGAIKNLNTTVASLASGGAVASSSESAAVTDSADLLSAITEALAETEAAAAAEEAASASVNEVVAEVAPTPVEATTQEDEAASEEILALLRNPTA
jgi:hypothetical protein